MVTQRQFDVIEAIGMAGEPFSQRQLAEITKHSLGSINKTIGELEATGLVLNGVLTHSGIKTLESFRVKRAVFIAAGFGTRLLPITLNTPKPLVRVKGKRIIDTLLDAVIAAGITEIYIVRGYLGEQFDQLLYKYPMIKFIENPLFNEANNIASAMCARYLFQNAYVFDGDLYLYNASLIKKYQYQSNYLGMPIELTDDWCFITENKVIKRMQVGGENCHHMFGISYWTNDDGTRLAGNIETVYNSPGGKERFWDQVALEYFVSDYKVHVRECQKGDIIEIDTFKELNALDSNYAL
jgi:CTP:phosphocholine cytidylyltransferase-like protein